MNLNITKKIADKWHVFAKIETNKFGKEQMNISLSNARKLVALIESEGKEFKNEKYLYIPVYEARPKDIDSHSQAKANAYIAQPDLDDAIPF